jgi:hypothetical protein
MLALLMALFIQDDTNTQIMNKIKAMQVDLDYSETPFEEVLTYLREFSGVNIIVDPAVDTSSMKVSIKVKSVRLQSAMRLIFSQFELVGIVKDGILHITTKDKRNQNVSIQIYDIRDLTVKINDFCGPRLELMTNQPSVIVIDPDPQPDRLDPDFIMELIRETCGGASWEENPNAGIMLTPNGQLMVAQTKEVHAEIKELVTRLREIK